MVYEMVVSVVLDEDLSRSASVPLLPGFPQNAEHAPVRSHKLMAQTVNSNKW
jgi:hypothetical protein